MYSFHMQPHNISSAESMYRLSLQGCFPTIFDKLNMHVTASLDTDFIRNPETQKQANPHVILDFVFRLYKRLVFKKSIFRLAV